MTKYWALVFLLISAVSQSASVDYVCNFHESWIGRSCNLRAIKLTDEQTPINIITTGTKKSLNEVIMVNIQYSQVKFIPNVIFEVFPNLTILKVDEDNRQLDNLQKHYFKGAVNLKKLWLKENSIKELKTDTFMETKTLEIIFLNKNRISKIEDGAFNGLSHLIELILDENLIVAMTPHTFDGLVKLEALSLWNNKIKEIEVGAFNSLRSLQKLYLNENSCVKEFVFSNVTAENFEEVYKSCEPSKDYYRDMLVSTRLQLEDYAKKSESMEQLLVEKDMEIQSLQISSKQNKLENRNLKLFCEYQKKKFSDRRN